jgi:hypothetical protein
MGSQSSLEPVDTPIPLKYSLHNITDRKRRTTTLKSRYTALKLQIIDEIALPSSSPLVLGQWALCCPSWEPRKT